MTKILATALISLICASTTFAETVTIYNMHSQTPWRLDKDGQYDIYRIQPGQIKISVNSFIDVDGSHLGADRVTLDCDGFISEIVPGSSQTCYLKKDHRASIYISENNFHNGAEGTIS